MTLLSSILAATVVTTFVLSRYRGSFAWNLTANFFLFVWVTTFAFPYFGELP